MFSRVTVCTGEEGPRRDLAPPGAQLLAAGGGYELVRKGYVERRPHPDDARARLVVLTDLGRECTRAAEAAAADAVRPWVELLGERRARALCDDLLRVAPNGPVRPSW
ncbi:MarR family winged helix-turn-helix transcriptional regulator [Streptomyces sp. SYSU K217416]